MVIDIELDVDVDRVVVIGWGQWVCRLHRLLFIYNESNFTSINNPNWLSIEGTLQQLSVFFSVSRSISHLLEYLYQSLLASFFLPVTILFDYLQQ